MKFFQQLLVAPAALGLLAPLSVSASEINLDAISEYSEDNLEIDGNLFKQNAPNETLLSGGEGLVDSDDYTVDSQKQLQHLSDLIFLLVLLMVVHLKKQNLPTQVVLA